MKNIFPKVFIKHILCFLPLLIIGISASGQQNRMVKVQQLYDSLKSYQITNPETVLATAIVETGWLECKDCSLTMNNLFGFRLDSGYIGFASYSDCLAYMKKWQQAFYIPWKAKHPDANYYDFLVYVNYAENMPDYIKSIQSLERWILLNVDANKSELAGLSFE